MKLINLNLMGGVIYGPMVEFIKKNSTDTDIFCFQEIFHNAVKVRSMLGNVRPNLFSDLEVALPALRGYYAAPLEDDVGSLAVFVKKEFSVNRNENIILFSELNSTKDENDEGYFSMGRNLQVVEFSHLSKEYTILNFHGMWIAKGKKDTDKRISQSEKVKKIFDEAKGGRILCTDLNVVPGTKSLAILKEGNKDLIQEYGITSTRSLFKKRSEIVDYVIVSPEVEVKDFKVLKDEVSDHLPLFLEFNSRYGRR